MAALNNDIVLLEKFSLFLSQGYEIKDIFAICSKTLPNQNIGLIKDFLDQGMSLEEAIKKSRFPKDFKEYFSFFVLNNDIGRAIKQAIAIVKMKKKLIDNLRKKLTYPSFLIIFLVIFSLFVNWGLLPQIFKLFKEFNIKMSLFQQLFFIFFSYLPTLIVLCFCLSAFIISFTIYAIKKQRFNLIDFLVFKIPVISPVIKKYYSIKFAAYYNELLNNGYNLTQIVELLYRQIGDSDLKMLVYEIKNNLIAGDDLDKALAKMPYFEDLFLSCFKLMLLDNRRDKSLKDYLDLSITAIERKIETILKITIPCIYFFVSSFVIMVYLSIILPMMNIVNEM